MKLNKSQKLLRKAKKIIPGGNQLLSKRSEMFLPNIWPNYYKKSVGCKIWDLENKSYYDFAGMGVTACSLGYSNRTINKALIKTFKNGSLTTLNSYEEYELAKIFLNIHKWADMAKFCKSGGEACMVAIRIARAYSINENIAFCGYHGWHDWYLSANLQNKKSLDKQLLTGLSTSGVSKSFLGSIFPFLYNDIKSLEKIIKKNKIGIIIMEPMRSSPPKDNFLKKVRLLANRYKCVLIFDEITSGWRMTVGGIHKIIKVNPDIVVYGKTIANGIPMGVIVGKKNVMNSSTTTFISSALWTERLGPACALEFIKKFKRKKVYKKIIFNGKKIKSIWKKNAKKHNLDIEVKGIDALASFRIKSKNWPSDVSSSSPIPILKSSSYI